MKVFSVLGALAVFAVTLLVTYYLHMRFFRVDVVLYSAILDAVIATAVLVALLFGARLFNGLIMSEKVLVAVIALLCGYIFAISIPTVIDRSLSFYILEKIQQRGGGIRQDAFQRVFTEEYVKEHRLVDVRLTEQEQSGTISIVNGCVKLTDRGQSLAAFSRFFRKNLLPRKRLLMGEYSDSLTDPFRNSQPITDYQCR
jgi:hypothetical protein